jgi:hypothetical protein
MGIEAGNESIEEYRARIQKMNDAELLRQGQAARFMCSPEANHGKAPMECYVAHLEECRKEWRKRHPKLPLSESILHPKKGWLAI